MIHTRWEQSSTSTRVMPLHSWLPHVYQSAAFVVILLSWTNPPPSLSLSRANEGARGAFTAGQAAAGNPASAAAAVASSASAAAMNAFGGQQDAPWASPTAMPRGNANADNSDDGARRAYFRAEEALMLAREQLARSEATLQEMGEVVDRAKMCIGEGRRGGGIRQREEEERERER